MALSLAGRNERLADLAVDYTSMSLHTADPGATGANELVGGAPAYARQAVAWSAPDNGTVALSNIPVFNVAQGVTVSHVGFWKGATFLQGFALTEPQPFVNAGTLTFDGFTIAQPAG